MGGEGSDEIFGGYKWYENFVGIYNSPLKIFRYLAKYIIPFYPNIKGQDRLKFVASNFYELLFLLKGANDNTLDNDFLKQFSGYDKYWHFKDNDNQDKNTINRLQYLDFKTYLPNDILVKTDKASMAHSLEVRVPFLDHKLVEFAFNLDYSIKNKNNELKYILKKSLDDILPDDILYRQKKGFSSPLNSWDEKGLLDIKDNRINILNKKKFNTYEKYKILVLNFWLKERGLSI